MPSRAAVSKWANAKSRKRGAGDAAIVRQIQREARQHGATLAHGGRGGIDPRLALKTFRKGKWRCQNPKCPTPKRRLDLDHQSGHPKEIREDPEASKDPKSMAAARDPDPKDNKFLRVICEKCHDRVHDREREIEGGKKPKPMRGDKR